MGDEEDQSKEPAAEVPGVDALEEAMKLLGLAMRSRQVQFGQDQVERSLRSGKVGMVWVTEDLAHNAAYKIWKVCNRAGVPCISKGSTSEMSARVGRDNIKVFILRKGRLAMRMHELLQAWPLAE
jgi:ribosomal protein L7Ae-like RNA K-turn-binding protein